MEFIDLKKLDVGVYAMMEDIKLPFTNFTIYKKTYGFITVMNNGGYLTTTEKDTHTRLQDFPCISFDLDNDGNVVGCFSVNLIGFMQRVVCDSMKNKYLDQFYPFLKKTKYFLKVE